MPCLYHASTAPLPCPYCAPALPLPRLFRARGVAVLNLEYKPMIPYPLLGQVVVVSDHTWATYPTVRRCLTSPAQAKAPPIPPPPIAPPKTPPPSPPPPPREAFGQQVLGGGGSWRPNPRSRPPPVPCLYHASTAPLPCPYRAPALPLPRLFRARGVAVLNLDHPPPPSRPPKVFEPVFLQCEILQKSAGAKGTEFFFGLLRV